jgi:predicted alpha/beta-fold hydrolase
MLRLARKLWHCGVQVVCLNLRGCGSGKGLARQPYHSGRSEDVLAVLDDLRQVTPHSPMALLGFSLGGNIVLKLAGELQAAAATYLRQVIAVSPPADLAACARLLAQPANRLYERRFVRLLRTDVLDRHARFPDLPRVELPEDLSLYAFDNLYTAPQCGFRNADDYYACCSAAPLVPQITIPCHILFAADDPLIDTTVLAGVDLPPTVQITYTTRGGHLGFLGIPGRPGGYRWMDTLLLEWIGAPQRRGLLWQQAVGDTS